MPLSTKQMEYLALAWQCFETEPKIDYEKFRQVAGLASANSARELMRVTKNKLKTEYGALSGSVQSTNGNGTPRTPTSGTGKKRVRAKKSVAEMNGDDEDDSEDQKSPSKRAKKSPKEKSKTPTAVKKEKESEAAGEESDGGEMF